MRREKYRKEAVRKLPSYHAIILAKNETGRVNLYRLVSESHLKYYNRRPKLPKSVYLKYQDGLMIGSACEAGELYQAILRGEPDEAIARLVDFYDYLEIQPIGNNAFMIKKEDVSAVESEEDLRRSTGASSNLASSSISLLWQRATSTSWIRRTRSTAASS